MAKKQRRETVSQLDLVSDALVAEVMHRYLLLAQSTDAIVEELHKTWTMDDVAIINRQTVRGLVDQANRRGLVAFRPPEATILEVAGRNAFPNARDVPLDSQNVKRKEFTVINVSYRHGDDRRARARYVNDQIAAAAAEVTLKLIKKIHQHKQQEQSGDSRVRIALGAGHTSSRVAMRLGQLLLKEPGGLPPLTIHASTSGFDLNPLEAPVTYFRYFDDTELDIEYVGLFSVPFAPNKKEYQFLIKQPGVRDAIEEARKVDLVITSLGQADDKHGVYQRFLNKEFPDQCKELAKDGYVGDVLYQSYSGEAPIHAKSGMRAVTLFSLEDLNENFVLKRDKYVVLVAGYCSECSKDKTQALRPLLHSESLNMWTHLVTNIDQMISLLPEETVRETRKAVTQAPSRF